LADQLPPNLRSSNTCARNAPRMQEVCQVWRSVREAFRKVTDRSREVDLAGVGRRWVSVAGRKIFGGVVSSRSGLFCLLK